MPYQDFAYFYDEFNGEADYEALFRYVHSQLTAHGITDGIVVDLGCGTGDLTLMLAQAGYDMIGVDSSEEMLSVLREKAADPTMAQNVLLLGQDILQLDLFGTIRGAVSTFDTFNHIGPYPLFEKAVHRAGFFMEQGGVFVFDLNTPYKHAKVLGNNQFEVDAPDALCRWQSRFDEKDGRVDLQLDIFDKEANQSFRENFSEYSYTRNQVEQALEKAGFVLAELCDGEDFGPVRGDNQRWMITAIKQYTQEEKTDNE